MAARKTAAAKPAADKPATDAPVVDEKPVEAQAPSAREKAAAGHAAERRADYVRALNEELDMCERAGKKDRVSAIKAEIKRVESVKDRKSPESDEA